MIMDASSSVSNGEDDGLFHALLCMAGSAGRNECVSPAFNMSSEIQFNSGSNNNGDAIWPFGGGDQSWSSVLCEQLHEDIQQPQGRKPINEPVEQVAYAGDNSNMINHQQQQRRVADSFNSNRRDDSTRYKLSSVHTSPESTSPEALLPKEEVQNALINGSNDCKVNLADERDIIPRENSFGAELQGLPSSDFMKFSQQSDMNRLMEEWQSSPMTSQKFSALIGSPVTSSLDLHNNLDHLPNFEEHDLGGCKFSLDFGNCPPAQKNRDWTYSEKLHKVYICMDRILRLGVKYMLPKDHEIPLHLRVFLCFKRAVSEPVRRCQNHLSSDKESLNDVRSCMLRCMNPKAQYFGTEDGRNIKDRFTVVIPLGRTVPGEDQYVRQTLEFQFKCQNSCLGRKETSLFFILESKSGSVLAQRFLDIKVCSCPRRDKQTEEGNGRSRGRKRSSYDDGCHQRRPKLRKSSGTSSNIKMEINDLTDDDLSVENEFLSNDENSIGSAFAKEHKVMSASPMDIHRTASGTYILTLETPSKEAALMGIETMKNKVAAYILNDPNCSGRYKENFQNFERLYVKAKKL